MTKKKHELVRSEGDISPLDRSIIEVMCHKCPFYAENQEYWEKEYECGAYKLVRQMVHEQYVDMAGLNDILVNQLHKVDKEF